MATKRFHRSATTSVLHRTDTQPRLQEDVSRNHAFVRDLFTNIDVVHICGE